MRSEAERVQIADHLMYELAMLWGTSRLLGSSSSKVLNNSVVEGMALHARNLIDFFYTAPQQDDVAATHFFSDPHVWPRVRPACPTVLQEAKTRANKEISHLTYTRLLVTPDDKEWPVGAIIEALDAALDVFCERADLLPERIKLLRYRDLLP